MIKNFKPDDQEVEDGSRLSSYGQNRGNLDRQTSRMTESNESQYFAREGVDPLTQAFSKKSTVHAGIGGEPVDASRIPGLWQEIMNSPREESSTAYIHIPFCQNRCLYCGFYKYSAERNLLLDYTDALIKELSLDRDKSAMWDYPVHAVYLGGGTPTVLEPGDLERLLLAIRKNLPLSNDCEITVESTISDLNQGHIEACLNGGANRFSIGVQSFDSAVRKALGRRKDRDSVLKALSKVRDKDEASVIIDLIYGLPGQNMTIWENDIQTFVDLELDGADLYQLNIFNGTPLAEAVETGRLSSPAGLAEQAHMFKRGVKIMEENHCRQLTTCHWSKVTRERNLYNQLMRSGAPCLPFGVGAGGSLGGYLCLVQNDLNTYFNELQAGCKPISGLLAEPVQKPLINSITGGLDLGVLDLEKVKRKHGVDLVIACQPLLTQWQQTGLVELKGKWLNLTLAGQFWQVNLAQSLIDYYLHTWTEKES